MKRSSPTWPLVRLGDLAEFRNGINYNKSNFGKGLKVVNVKDFGDRLVAVFDGLEEVNPEGIQRDECLLRDGDILFVRSNGNRELIGRSMYVRGVREPVTHSAFSIKVRFSASDALPRFYAYLFRTSIIRRELSNRGGGTNISNLNQEILNDLEVPRPPRSSQEKITAILTAYDDLIENNTRRIAVLEEMAHSLYREWFVRFRFPGHEQVKFVKSPEGRVPEGWSRLLSEIADVNSESIKKGAEPETINYVDIASVSTGKIDAVVEMSFDAAPGRARRIVQHGDMIWSTVRPNRKSYALILKPLDNMVASTGFAVIRGTVAPFTYLYSALTTESFVKYLVNHAKGSAYPAVNADDFENAPVLVPPAKLMAEFHQRVEAAFLLKHNLLTRNENLRKTRDLLLPKLISGELDVERLDIDTGDPAPVVAAAEGST